MKRFIASISTNTPDKLKAKLFINTSEDPALAQPKAADGSDRGVISPIMLPLYNAVAPGERVGISLIVTTEDADAVSNDETQIAPFIDEKGTVRPDRPVTADTQENFVRFMKELDSFFCKGNADKTAAYDLEIIFAPREETPANSIALMRALLDAMVPGETGGIVEVYADVSFGIRVLTVLMQMIFRYANNVQDTTVVKTVTYSQYLPGAERQKLQDLSYLIHLDNALHHAEGLSIRSIGALLDLIEATIDEA